MNDLEGDIEQVQWDALAAKDDELYNRFVYHSPSTKGAQRHQRLSDQMYATASMVEDLCPNGREKSLALTKLEEAKFWASASVARNPETR